MKVSAWKGATYGIRVGKDNAQRFFSQSYPIIEVDIDGKVHSFRLRDTFWTTCPEFRGKAIEEWLRKNGLIPWARGEPPELRLIELGQNQFQLSK